MKAYTDYPFEQFGDEPYKESPIREVEVLSYDGDKYCSIKVCGVVEELKAGYLYESFGRYGDVKCVSLKSLKLLPLTISD